MEAATTSSIIPPSYPSDYMGKLKSTEKPPLHTYDLPAPDAYHHLKLLLDANKWDDLTVTAFMVAVIKENIGKFSVKAKEPWVAWDRTVTNQEGYCSALSMYDVIGMPDPPDPPATILQSDAKLRLSLFFGLVCIYRRVWAVQVNPTYGIIINKKINRLFYRCEVWCSSGNIHIISNTRDPNHLNH